MQIKFEFDKDKILSFLVRFKQKLSVLCGNILDWSEKKLFAIKPVFREHKETFLKTLLPLLIIFIGFYSCSLRQKNIAQNISELFKIADEIREYYLDKPDYWGLSTEFAAKKQLIDTKFISDDKIVLSSGSEIFIGDGEKADVLMPSSQTFDISLRHLNKAECIAYSEAKFSEERLLEIMRITIVNESGHYAFEWGGEHPLPIQKYAAKDFCHDSDNTFIWSIK